MTNDEGFFREVEEDYRRHQFMEAMRKYGIYIAGAAFLIVAVVAGYTINRHYALKAADKGGDAFVDALILSDEGKTGDARKAFTGLAETGASSYRVLARLHIAADAIDKKQPDLAIAQYRNVSDDAVAPSALRDFAKVQLAALSVDTVPYDTVSKDLAPFRNGNGPWRFLAKETLGLAAFKAGRKQDAEKLFQEIYSDGGAPQGMRQRAEVMLALIVENPKPSLSKGATANDAKTQ